MTQKHIHLIGICGTAMASLAGMLQQRGFRVSGSDAAAYPPMSDFLGALNIAVSQPFSESNLQPRPDLVVVGNAISRGNVELELVLDQRIPFQSMAQLLYERVPDRQNAPGSCRHARQDHHLLAAGLALPSCRTGAQLPDWRDSRELWQLIRAGFGERVYPGRR